MSPKISLRAVDEEPYCVDLFGTNLEKLIALTKTMIHKSIILPHLEYCSSIMFMAIKENFQKQQLLQNRAPRVILKKSKRTSIRWIFDTPRLDSVKQRVNFNILVLVFKMKKGIVPNTTCTIKCYCNCQKHADDFWLPQYQKARTQNMI
jgi:hypothetical protein